MFLQRKTNGVNKRSAALTLKNWLNQSWGQFLVKAGDIWGQRDGERKWAESEGIWCGVGGEIPVFPRAGGEEISTRVENNELQESGMHYTRKWHFAQTGHKIAWKSFFNYFSKIDRKSCLSFRKCWCNPEFGTCLKRDNVRSAGHYGVYFAIITCWLYTVPLYCTATHQINKCISMKR